MQNIIYFGCHPHHEIQTMQEHPWANTVLIINCVLYWTDDILTWIPDVNSERVLIIPIHRTNFESKVERFTMSHDREWRMMEKTHAIEEKRSDLYKYKVKNIEDNNRTNINNISSQNEFWIKSWTWFPHTSCELSNALSITCFGVTLLYSVMLMLRRC
jgi:hypothetical protein